MTPVPTPAEVRTVLARGEGQFVEFKSAWDRGSTRRKPLGRRGLRDKIADAVAAFANAGGGLLLVGVEDDGTVTGHGYPDLVVDDFFAVPRRRLIPSVACRTERLALECHEILAFQVPIAPEAVMIKGNGFPYRVGSHVIREPRETINQQKQAYRRVGYEPRFRPEATVDDLDLALAESFLKDTPVGDRPVIEALDYYGLIEMDARDWRVTNAALLLFARRPALRWHPRAGLRVFRVSGTEIKYGRRRNVTQIGRADPPLASAIHEIRDLARHQVGRTERLAGLHFRDVPEYPDFAWQEALVNAVAHRDYEVRSRETEIWFFKDRLEVSSPGELLPPVTVETLREGHRAHVTRNPMLVRVLADAEVMRDEGEGIVRVFREMANSFLSEPEMTSESGLFTITLFNEPDWQAHGPGWRHFVNWLRVTDDQKRMLLLRPHGFTQGDYERLNTMAPEQAARRIQDLVARELLVVLPSGDDPTPTFAIRSDHNEFRLFLNDRIMKLRAHFQQQNWVKNADYREVFDVDRRRATRELRQLAEVFGLLQMEGTRRGAHYRPTSALGMSL
ncbi:MAG: putative DNA binding domain-containing protein [Gemmatimonadetes bacterium]|nr:putative DNA binding domain-containing protein [Gemmatimonadota bacterium]